MTRLATRTLILLVSLLITSTTLASHSSGNWKRGRIYYRMVCTTCHVSERGEAISPADKTIAEWKKYMSSDQHQTSDNAIKKVSYYSSKEFRESVKDSNKAAAKFIKVPEEELFDDVRAYVVHTAKDSDNPARCNK